MPQQANPPPHGAAWERAAPADAGFDPDSLDVAIRFALAHETPWPRDLRAYLEGGQFEPPPYGELLGPIRGRGPPNGLLLRHGRMVASWGNTRQVDFTFSVAKSYLSLLAGLAWADGLIPDLDEPIGKRVHDGGFDRPHNGAITWRHMLQQTSEWEGELFGKADMIDRNPTLRPGVPPHRWRQLQAPGTYWEYNDVRVNRFSLALLRVFRRPLPEVFAERIMAPIGGSTSWAWHGYRTSLVEIDGRMIESVSGGSHWGGGVETHAEDQARIGLLMLQRGAWDGRRVLPEAWITQSLTPCTLNASYGFLWWLNNARHESRSASRSSFFAIGAGGNQIWIDPANGIVGVMRWIDPDAVDGFIAHVTAALRSA
ncbi:MAG: serine hydrolase [Pseudomonadota bacterium]|nr:serine hydrolase [Pseudomonadota bacterium]